MSNLHPLEFVGRNSEKQLQVGVNLKAHTQAKIIKKIGDFILAS